MRGHEEAKRVGKECYGHGGLAEVFAIGLDLDGVGFAYGAVEGVNGVGSDVAIAAM